MGRERRVTVTSRREPSRAVTGCQAARRVARLGGMDLMVLFAVPFVVLGVALIVDDLTS
jgi:hypothetical protein